MARFFNKEFRSSTAEIPLFSLGCDVSFYWSSVKGALQYRYQIVDMHTLESVKLTITSKPLGFLSADRNICNTTYKVDVHALGERESIIGAWQHFFHAGLPAILPENESIHHRKIFFRNGAPVSGSAVAGDTAGKPSFTSPFMMQNDLKKQADCMLANRYFLSYNSNNVKHWMNETLEKSYAADVRNLIDDPEVGYVSCNHGLEKDAFFLLNAYRSRHHMPEFFWNDNLARVARARAIGHVLAPGYSHVIPCVGGALAESFARWGLKPQTGLRENIAWMSNNFAQQYSADDIMHAWVNSPTHNENILRSARYVGLGVIHRENTAMEGLEAVMISVL